MSATDFHKSKDLVHNAIIVKYLIDDNYDYHIHLHFLLLSQLDYFHNDQYHSHNVVVAMVHIIIHDCNLGYNPNKDHDCFTGMHFNFKSVNCMDHVQNSFNYHKLKYFKYKLNYY